MIYHNILVPIAFDADRDLQAQLSLARRLAAPEAQVTLMHVIEQVPSYAMSYISADYLAEARSAIRAELQDLAAEIPNARAQVVEGHPGRSIMDWAKANKPDLIIVASHRPGMQDLLLGSTAAHVVRSAHCSVHVVR
ncbi:Nucleotide-binding universal stress protein, UspA family [Pontibaca methylaminivorans]|uniref:Nucleotide-binding universal stress protein, UspA family n=1 Tax=Pontibaca methylaminivorans TaxID=515897 RepID=A0A1R3WY09_9RHOB|nr:Nucleotide-binding universal stress protein, UspA family [Pontibaca methylaminivorans]